MKSFRVTKTVKQLEEQKKLEQAGLNQLEQFFGLVADPTIHVTPVEFPEKKTEPISLDGLNEFFQLLSTVEPNIPVVIQNEETIVALEEIKEQVELSVVDKAVDTISKAAVKEAVFEVPNNAKVENNIKALQARVETLQNWISKIAATGPGSGEVNFRWLDDVNRSSINDSWLLEYDAATKKFQFTENIGPIRTVQFNTSGPQIPLQSGQLGWNVNDETVDLEMSHGVTQQLGQETYARVKNETGVLIPNGTVVGFVGASSDALSIAPYLANGAQPSLYILGIMTHDLPDSGNKGYCTTWGFVRDLNTSAFNQGDVLYASPTVAGGLTNTKPTAPNNVIPVAACIISSATAGVIFVRPTITQMQYYGTFSKISNQTPVSINTAYALTFDVTDISNGVMIGTPASKIVVPQSGLYQFSVTVQVTSSNTSAKNIWLWFRKNGTDIPNSARLVTININSGYIPVAIHTPVSLNANEYVEIMYAASDVGISISTVASTAFAPASPAAELEVTQVQQ